MSILQNTVSGFIDSQLPGYIRDNYPNFQLFLKHYFKWMEDSQKGEVVYHTKNLINYKNVDETTEEFLQYFQADFLPNFPKEAALNLRKLLKTATKFYQTKGSENSVEFLFRALYNLDAEVYYPKKNVLRLSDGRWQLPQSVKLVLGPANQSFDISLLLGRAGVGLESNSVFVIESVQIAIDPTLNREIVELYLSSISQQFIPGEFVSVDCGLDVLGDTITFSEKIIGSLSGITINPTKGGLKYIGTQYNTDGTIAYNGDPVVIVGGTAESQDVIKAVAYVGNVSQGTVQSITVQRGGYGYQLDPNTLIRVVNSPTDNTGTGAAAIVDAVDTANQVLLTLSTDSIGYKANVVLNSANYAFSNFASTNVNTQISRALTFVTIPVAPIAHMNVTNPGTGYTEVPTLNLLSVFDTDFSGDLHSVYLSAPTVLNYELWAAARAAIRDLGKIAAIEVLNGGNGYSNVTDTIAVDSAIGMNATFNFVTGANGTITRVIVTNGGLGYSAPKPEVFVCNSANLILASNGTGAVLKAYGYNEGEILQLSVSDLGRIQTIRIANRGFDYTSTPEISLRVQDVTVTPLGNTAFYFQGDRVFQGANANSTTFLAFVDEYDRSNSILRLYNYTGAINIQSQLIGANQNASPISVHIYGNGKAKANAEFFGGLIKYPGFWLTTDGFLSADQNFEDDIMFHNYSYVVKAEKSLASYEDVLSKITHPAGTRVLALTTVTDDRNITLSANDAPVQTTNTINHAGTVTVNAFANGVVLGFGGTSFAGNVNVGDLFILSSNTDRIQVKEVINVVNANVVILESNTYYFATDTLLMSNGSNVVIDSTSTSNLAANDIIKTNVNGNAQTSLVVVVSLGANTITVNTVFSQNASAAQYQVWPRMDNVAYEVYNAR